MEEINKIERSGGKLGKAILTLSTKFTEDILEKNYSTLKKSLETWKIYFKNSITIN